MATYLKQKREHRKTQHDSCKRVPHGTSFVLEVEYLGKKVDGETLINQFSFVVITDKSVLGYYTTSIHHSLNGREIFHLNTQ